MRDVEQTERLGAKSCIKCGAPVWSRALLGMCNDCLRSSAGLKDAPPAVTPSNPNKTHSELGPDKSFDSGRFTLVQQLGSGGMGVVWLAVDERLSRAGEPTFVALKFLAPSIRDNPLALDMLKREVLQSRRLDHPHILRIYDWHEHAGEPVFFSMEYLAGETLRQKLESRDGKPFTWEELRPLMIQWCEALDYAHRVRDIVHRDLKPANVMVTAQGVLKLADFGLATPATHESRPNLHQTDARGTLPYMSPQQMSGAQPKPVDDIYSLGASVYELLTGTLPFEDEPDIHKAIHSMQPRSMGERLRSRGFRDEIPARVRNAVGSCLAKDPKLRPQSVRELYNLLNLAESIPVPLAPKSGDTTVIVRPTPEFTMAPAPRRSRLPGSLVTLLLLALAAIAGAWFYSGAKSPDEFKSWLQAKWDQSAKQALSGSSNEPVKDPKQDTSEPIGSQSWKQSNELRAVPSMYGRLTLKVVNNKYINGLYYVVKSDDGMVCKSNLFNPHGINEIPGLRPGSNYVVEAGYNLPQNGSRWVSYETDVVASDNKDVTLDFRPGDLYLVTTNEKVRIDRYDAWGNKTGTFYVRSDGSKRDLKQSPTELKQQPNLAGPVTYVASIPGEKYIPAQTIKWRILAGAYDTKSLEPFTPSSTPMMELDWTNDLGMQLIWLGSFWVSTSKVTVGQYGKFMKSHARNALPTDGKIVAITANGSEPIEGSWSKPGFEQHDDHPVVGVSWEDATNFCALLTFYDQKAGRLKTNQRYTLPTDDQWTQLATPLGHKYAYLTSDTPGEGGNYAHSEVEQSGKWPAYWSGLYLPGPPDPYPRTSPVGMYPKINRLLDIGGNAAEWCMDYYTANMNLPSVREADSTFFADGGGKKYRVIRGSSWFDYEKIDLATTTRHRAEPNERNDRTSFRVILVEDATERASLP